MKRLCFALCICLLLTGCGSASSDYEYKDDLSDVIVKDYDYRDYGRMDSFPHEMIFEDVGNLHGVFTNYEELGIENNKRYFVYFYIYYFNGGVDADGNIIQPLPEPDPEIFKNAVEDFEQYCKDYDIPYVIYDHVVDYEYGVLLHLCISPDQFFKYERLPQIDYDISLIMIDSQQEFDKFLSHVKKGEVRVTYDRED